MKKLFLRSIFYICVGLAKINRSYDKLQEPKRFFCAMGFAMTPWLILDIAGMITNHKGWEFLGMFWILAIIAVRFWWIKGNLQDCLKFHEANN